MSHEEQCPTCGHVSQQMKRSIHHNLARLLLWVRLHHQRQPFHMKSSLNHLEIKARDEGTLRYFGLIEKVAHSQDGNGGTGWWRLTATGLQFAEGALKLPQYVYIKHAKVRGFEGPNVGIDSCLKKDFDRDELLVGPSAAVHLPLPYDPTSDWA